MRGRVQDTQKFITMWNDGIREVDIAKEFGVDQTTVSITSKRLGLSPRHIRTRGRTTPHVTERLKGKIISVINKYGACPQSEILKKCSTPSAILRTLVRTEEISTFRLCASGHASKNKAIDLFNGITSKCYYYLDKELASKFIIEKLDLTTDLPFGEKRALTQHLRRCLKPDLFQIVHKSYTTRHADMIDNFSHYPIMSVFRDFWNGIELQYQSKEKTREYRDNRNYLDRADYLAKYRFEHREERRIKARIYRQKPEVKERDKQYKKLHRQLSDVREREKQQHKRYYATHKHLIAQSLSVDNYP